MTTTRPYAILDDDVARILPARTAYAEANRTGATVAELTADEVLAKLELELSIAAGPGTAVLKHRTALTPRILVTVDLGDGGAEVTAITLTADRTGILLEDTVTPRNRIEFTLAGITGARILEAIELVEAGPAPLPYGHPARHAEDSYEGGHIAARYI